MDEVSLTPFAHYLWLVQSPKTPGKVHKAGEMRQKYRTDRNTEIF